MSNLPESFCFDPARTLDRPWPALRTGPVQSASLQVIRLALRTTIFENVPAVKHKSGKKTIIDLSATALQRTTPGGWEGVSLMLAPSNVSHCSLASPLYLNVASAFSAHHSWLCSLTTSHHGSPASALSAHGSPLRLSPASALSPHECISLQSASDARCSSISENISGSEDHRPQRHRPPADHTGALASLRLSVLFFCIGTINRLVFRNKIEFRSQIVFRGLNNGFPADVVQQHPVQGAAQDAAGGAREDDTAASQADTARGNLTFQAKCGTNQCTGPTV